MANSQAIISKYKFTNPTVDEAKYIFNSCDKDLSILKKEISTEDLTFLDTSTKVADELQLMFFDMIKKVENDIYNPKKYFDSNNIIREAFILNIKLKKFNMTEDFISIYKKRSETMLEIQGKASFIPTNKNWSLLGVDEFGKPIYKDVNQSNKKSNGGCYIATMAYGDYDHPQVMELRRFRDDFLDKTIVGRRFIKFYYKYSPSLVERLKNKKNINLITRNGLDQFIKAIKK